MSLTEQELIEHCETILLSRRIRDRIVILCEGDINQFKGARSPQLYGRMETLPDANFYSACIPTWWRNYRLPMPQFFTCGSRYDVLMTFFKLKELHQIRLENQEGSYLNPDKLFALVDADLQTQPLENYSLGQHTEQIFAHIYTNGRINEQNLAQHHIWVTGLTHKEGYFLLPITQPELTEFAAVFQNQPAALETIYLQICSECGQDADLQQHFAQLGYRIQHCVGLNCQDIQQFETSWLQQFNQSNIAEKEQLIMALLMVRKAKPYWHQIEPSANDSRTPENFREQLSLQIARLYSQEDMSSHHHLPTFFKVLHQTIYG